MEDTQKVANMEFSHILRHQEPGSRGKKKESKYTRREVMIIFIIITDVELPNGNSFLDYYTSYFT
jgi:hypothetical protein